MDDERRFCPRHQKCTHPIVQRSLIKKIIGEFETIRSVLLTNFVPYRYPLSPIVIIPTFNEIENIEAIIRKVFSLSTGFHILVVDDNSPDGTAAKVKSLMAELKDALHLLERPGKAGLGRAYIAGFRWCIDRKYNYIIEMDADFSHNPLDLPRL